MQLKSSSFHLRAEFRRQLSTDDRFNIVDQSDYAAQQATVLATEYRHHQHLRQLRMLQTPVVIAPLKPCPAKLAANPHVQTFKCHPKMAVPFRLQYETTKALQKNGDRIIVQ